MQFAGAVIQVTHPVAERVSGIAGIALLTARLIFDSFDGFGER